MSPDLEIVVIHESLPVSVQGEITGTMQDCKSIEPVEQPSQVIFWDDVEG